MLIVFGGLPGTGKTTVSRGLSRRLGAAWLRIDTIEQAIRRSAGRDATVAAAGYDVAQSLAADNLSCGRTVVADCVNPVAASRRGWAAVASDAGARLLAVHVVCSDAALHRRRVEERVPDIAGHVVPTWSDVLARDFEPWPDAHLTIDTAILDPGEAIEAVEAALARLAGARS